MQRAFSVSLLFVILTGPIDSALAGPLSPAESIKQMVFPKELKVELVASEPQVIDPVAIAFDENLALWVVEMSDYPNGPAAGEKPKSRIKILFDQDNDGHYETAHTFADELLFATGIQPWKGGVIVTLAGEVAWLKDTDGDFKADIHETWFTGFSQDNPQLRANHPTFGPDNWIYIANGLRGGKVIAVKPEWAKDAKPLDISGKDFRFDPISGKYEAITGTGQFGLTFDQFGNRFICSNRNPCMQVVIEDRYLKRNPHLAVSKPLHDVGPAGADSKIFPISRAWTTSNLHAGQFTAACGVTFHDGYGLPSEFLSKFYTCDPTGNLVHLTNPDYGPALITSRPPPDNVEFLASPDEWFRPVNLANGPDGALYIVDMYRAVIEHPQWVPVELKDRRDTLSGNDRGRIYRICERNPSEIIQQLFQVKPVRKQDAASMFEGTHSRPWQAETVRRLLIQEQDDETARPLIEQTLGKEPAFGVHRRDFGTRKIASLVATAAGTGTLGEGHLLAAFRSFLELREPNRNWIQSSAKSLVPAIRHSEPFLRKNQQLRTSITRLIDHSARVRYQIALSLGEATLDEATLDSLVEIALRDAASEPHRIAVLSSVSGSERKLLEQIWVRVESVKAWGRPGMRDLVGEVARVIGARKVGEEVAAVRQLIAQSVELAQKADVEGDELDRRRFEMAAFRGLVSAGGHQPVDLVGQPPQETAGSMRVLFESAAVLAVSEPRGKDVRLEALATLGTGEARVPEQASTLKRIFNESSNAELRGAALGGLARLRQDDLGATLLAAWPKAGPAMRRELLNAFMATPAAAEVLAREVIEERISAADLTPAHRTRLLRILQGESHTAMQKAFVEAAPEDRREVVARYQASLKLDGDAENGQKLFEKNCTVCHRIGKLGVNVAPDISDSRTKTPAQLLEAILDPNRAVDANYFGYSLVTNAGKVYSGIISAETANSVTLKLQEGKTITILRSEIDELRNTGVSLMPVGQEKNLSEQEMADLISFIKNWRYLDGRTPLGPVAEPQSNEGKP
ncbi:MAG: c-type cytochrome [Planctomycetota bacterium]|nr:c-type cytochrome [Planctomycetota bacterium]